MSAPLKKVPLAKAPQPERRSWFDLVRTDAGWHVRLTGINGEPVMASEVHPDKRDAEHVYALCRGAMTRSGYIDERSRPAGVKSVGGVQGGAGPVSVDEAEAGPVEAGDLP